MITEDFDLVDDDFVGHVGEVTIEEEDGRSLPIIVKVRCVKSSHEYLLSTDLKVEVKGIMRRLEGRSLCRDCKILSFFCRRCAGAGSSLVRRGV